MLHFTDMENLELETCRFDGAENTEEPATRTFSVVQVGNCLVVAGTQPSAQPPPSHVPDLNPTTESQEP